jgi:hypothetical protein
MYRPAEAASARSADSSQLIYLGREPVKNGRGVSRRESDDVEASAPPHAPLRRMRRGRLSHQLQV